MTDLFLGLIALAVLVMAAIQVAAIIFAARAARQVREAVSRLEQQVKPIVASLPPILANVQAVTAEASRATAAATAQVERAGRLIEDFAVRLDRTVVSAQEAILRPARQSLAFIEKVRGIFFGAFRRSGGKPRPGAIDDDDALFIG